MRILLPGQVSLISDEFDNVVAVDGNRIKVPYVGGRLSGAGDDYITQYKDVIGGVTGYGSAVYYSTQDAKQTAIRLAATLGTRDFCTDGSYVWHCLWSNYHAHCLGIPNPTPAINAVAQPYTMSQITVRRACEHLYFLEQEVQRLNEGRVVCMFMDSSEVVPYCRGHFFLCMRVPWHSHVYGPAGAPRRRLYADRKRFPGMPDVVIFCTDIGPNDILPVVPNNYPDPLVNGWGAGAAVPFPPAPGGGPGAKPDPDLPDLAACLRAWARLTSDAEAMESMFVRSCFECIRFRGWSKDNAIGNEICLAASLWGVGNIELGTGPFKGTVWQGRFYDNHDAGVACESRLQGLLSLMPTKAAVTRIAYMLSMIGSWSLDATLKRNSINPNVLVSSDEALANLFPGNVPARDRRLGVSRYLLPEPGETRSSLGNDVCTVVGGVFGLKLSYNVMARNRPLRRQLVAAVGGAAAVMGFYSPNGHYDLMRTSIHGSALASIGVSFDDVDGTVSVQTALGGAAGPGVSYRARAGGDDELGLQIAPEANEDSFFWSIPHASWNLSILALNGLGFNAAVGGTTVRVYSQRALMRGGSSVGTEPEKTHERDVLPPVAMFEGLGGANGRYLHLFSTISGFAGRSFFDQTALSYVVHGVTENGALQRFLASGTMALDIVLYRRGDGPVAVVDAYINPMSLISRPGKRQRVRSGGQLDTEVKAKTQAPIRDEDLTFKNAPEERAVGANEEVDNETREEPAGGGQDGGEHKKVDDDLLGS